MSLPVELVADSPGFFTAKENGLSSVLTPALAGLKLKPLPNPPGAIAVVVLLWKVEPPSEKLGADGEGFKPDVMTADVGDLVPKENPDEAALVLMLWPTDNNKSTVQFPQAVLNLIYHI